jgi:hypothetical protein
MLFVVPDINAEIHIDNPLSFCNNNGKNVKNQTN